MKDPILVFTLSGVRESDDGRAAQYASNIIRVREYVMPNGMRLASLTLAEMGSMTTHCSISVLDADCNGNRYVLDTWMAAKIAISEPSLSVSELIELSNARGGELMGALGADAYIVLRRRMARLKEAEGIL